MPLSTRNIILFQPQTFGNEIYNELSAHDFNVYIANNLKQVSDLLNEHLFKVGLCLLNDKCSYEQCLIDKSCMIGDCSGIQQLSHLKHIFSLQTPINWVVGLPSSCSKKVAPDSTENKLITEYFYNYISIPIDIGLLIITLNQAYDDNNTPEYSSTYPTNFGIIGNSSAMLNLFSRLAKIVKEDCSVLIEGETGTGKELIANAIHKHSSRSAHPHVVINCGAFPKDLIQAELFGYEKGAFTGALERKIGFIESAQNGTLFFDEIGDLPHEQQVNLLRFLEDRTIKRIGGIEKIPVNVRVIAATHVDLKVAVQRGEFREDLYYRLRVLQLKTPPLRARENDIELIANYFFNKFSTERIYKAKGFHRDTLRLLNYYDWPGNVRELMNCIYHAIVMSENRLLSPEDLGLDRGYKINTLLTLEQARSLAERASIITSLRVTNNNYTHAAETLGISRVSLYRLINKYSIKAEIPFQLDKKTN
ncbi:MAG: sigma-54 dependent transcriptional regulator [Methylococcales bacterium]|nr:sigma-54 dependent transcriptional regulator [Methylococcales bacterium]